MGDVLSYGLTNWLRNRMNINHVIDRCSWSYSAGTWAGYLHGIAFSGAGLLHGGARTVLYSGEGALETARLAKGTGRLLEDTLGGQLLKVVNQHVVTVPDAVWSAASGIFAANAKGEVAVFLRNPHAQSILNTVEKPVLSLVNKINSSVTGRTVTTIIQR
jgi:hypothetical protein